jgi:hypothetical protein
MHSGLHRNVLTSGYLKNPIQSEMQDFAFNWSSQVVDNNLYTLLQYGIFRLSICG